MFGSRPYFYFRFRLYGHRDGRFCLIFARTAAQRSVLDDTDGLSSSKACVYCRIVRSRASLGNLCDRAAFLLLYELPHHHVKSNEVLSVMELVFRCGRRLAGIWLSLSWPEPSWHGLPNSTCPNDARWDLQHTTQAYSIKYTPHVVSAVADLAYVLQTDLYVALSHAHRVIHKGRRTLKTVINRTNDTLFCLLRYNLASPKHRMDPVYIFVHFSSTPISILNLTMSSESQESDVSNDISSVGNIRNFSRTS